MNSGLSIRQYSSGAVISGGKLMHILVLFFACVLVQRHDQNVTELRSLQGTWITTKYFMGNQYVPEEFLPLFQRVITDDTMTVKFAGKVTGSNTIRIDPTKSPKVLDIIIGNGEGKGRVIPCIYDLQGDTLKICAPARNNSRPTDFTIPKQGERWVVHLRREPKK
jgi:uncharacterized protein (TIGR03067 family)